MVPASSSLGKTCIAAEGFDRVEVCRAIGDVLIRNDMAQPLGEHTVRGFGQRGGARQQGVVRRMTGGTQSNRHWNRRYDDGRRHDGRR